MIRFRKGYRADMGTDIVLNKIVEIKPGTQVIDLDVTLNVRANDVAFLVGRTSTSRAGLIVHQCIIDPHYCGSIHAIVTNTTNRIIKLEPGDAFCSVVYCKGIKFHRRNTKPEIKKAGRRTTSIFGGTGNGCQ